MRSCCILLRRRNPSVSNYGRSWLCTNLSCCCVSGSLAVDPHSSDVAVIVKQKWERIVSRRYGGREEMTSPTSSGSIMLEGIKEGVQGVSRFLAAGLGDFSAPRPTPRPIPRPSTGSSSTSSDVVIVEDTGATPTVQPNLAFLRRRRDCMRDLDTY
jgi:hypothetical protein